MAAVKTQQRARLMEAEQRKTTIGRYDDIRPEIVAKARRSRALLIKGSKRSQSAPR